MKRTFDRTQLGPRCMVCGKGRAAGVNKPHSQKRTKRIVGANIQSFFGVPVCTRCLRSMRAKQAEVTPKEAVAAPAA